MAFVLVFSFLETVLHQVDFFYEKDKLGILDLKLLAIEINFHAVTSILVVPTCLHPVDKVLELKDRCRVGLHCSLELYHLVLGTRVLVELELALSDITVNMGNLLRYVSLLDCSYCL